MMPRFNTATIWLSGLLLSLAVGAIACTSRSRQAVVQDGTSTSTGTGTNAGGAPAGAKPPGAVEGAPPVGGAEKAPGGTVIPPAGTPPVGIPGSETPSGTVPPAGDDAGGLGTPASGSTQTPAEGKAFVGTWTGAEDEIPATSPFTVRSVSGINVTQTSQASGTAGAGNSSASSVAASATWDGGIGSLIQQRCTSCHSSSGTGQTPLLDSYEAAKAQGSRVVARSGDQSNPMPPSGALSQSDVSNLQAWQNAGYPKSSSGAAGSAAGGASDNSGGLLSTLFGSGNSGNSGGTDNSGSSGPKTVSVRILEGSSGGFMNTDPPQITARVKDTLEITNGRSSGGFVIHAGGQPFDHGDVGNPIQPGSSAQYLLNAPYSPGPEIYEHDSPDPSQTKLNLTVQ